jgi:ribosome-binding protein aMBF1 (putative translation factor)
MKRDILTRPFEAAQIKRRQGHHGKEVAYVDVAAVITRLNEAFEHEWTFEITSHEIQENEVIVVGRLTAGGITKMHFGGSSITLDREGRIVSMADDLKAAASDALKKCASLLGVALEMYGGASERQPASSHAKGTNGTHPAPVSVSDRVTERQLAAIESARRRHGVSRDELEARINKRTGKAALQLLTRREASEILSEFDQRNGTQPHHAQ